ncbi:uncharacterized protein [Montipora foliosa]|uniref:uncharacterized protein isoform X1 n=2 Tax=Montipora foliosa TaxID=591990 RepID=UPI0035F1C262
MANMANVNPTQIGLAFSGGGIRSAAFSSGVLRRLLERNVEVDYLSCVSGGGYTGTAFLDWKYREERRSSSTENETEDQGNWHDKFFKHMKERAGYFCNWHSPLDGILDTVTILGLILLVNFIGPITTRGSYACPIAFMIDLMFGEYLRDKGDCDDVVAAKFSDSHNPEAGKNATIQELRQSCKSNPGSGRIILFSLLVLLTAIFFVLSKKGFLRRYSTLLSFSCAIFGASFVLTFVPFALHDVVRDIPHWSQYLAVAVSIFVWFFLPLLRNVTTHVLMVYFFSYVIYWRVYAAPVLGVVYSDKLFARLLFASGFVVWVAPLVYALSSRLTHVYNRWRLQKAFYHPSGLGKNGCSGIGWSDVCTLWISALCQSRHRSPDHAVLANEGVVPKRALTVEDLKGTKPEYISNITVNRWKRDETSEKNYDLLTISPTSIARVDSKPGQDHFKGKLEPEDIKLSDAMATSAAALSTYMGKYDNSPEMSLSRFHTLIGLNMGTRMISDIQSVRKETFIDKVLPFAIDAFRALPLICVPPIVHFGVADSDFASKVAVICFIVIHFVLAWAAFVHTGSRYPGWREKLARWFIVHISFVQFIRETFSKNNIGPMPPPVLLLSDGGHFENLALLPLLKKRLKKIVVVDGGQKEDDMHYGDSLLKALMLARTQLDCSFLSKDGGDVISFLFDAFQEPKKGKLPRFFKFKVQYKEGQFGGSGDGEIMLITPRYPTDSVSCPPNHIPSVPLYPFNDEADGLAPGMCLKASDVDNLTWCCCPCCHGHQCWGLSAFCCDTFPQHSTLNQFFTSRMFAAYHREGYRACVEAEKDDFMKSYGIREQQSEDAINIV